MINNKVLTGEINQREFHSEVVAKARKDVVENAIKEIVVGFSKEEETSKALKFRRGRERLWRRRWLLSRRALLNRKRNSKHAVKSIEGIFKKSRRRGNFKTEVKRKFLILNRGKKTCIKKRDEQRKLCKNNQRCKKIHESLGNLKRAAKYFWRIFDFFCIYWNRKHEEKIISNARIIRATTT